MAADAGPLIVLNAPNGARKSSADHRKLPITPAELADCAKAILDAGAALMHVHVRGTKGEHTLDTDSYRVALAAIRDAVGERLVMQVTSEACGIYDAGAQMAMVRELRPEAVSLALKELCPDDSRESDAAQFFAWVDRERIMPQYILYTPDEVRRFENFRARGIVGTEKPFVLFVLGRYSDSQLGDVAELPRYVEALAADTCWSVCSFGVSEHAAVEAAIAAGGHVRVGFENNLQREDGTMAADNAELVALAAAKGIAAGRQPMTADEVREAFLA